MDKIDRVLIRLLERDGRLSYAELGERAGLSKAACWKRVQALEAQGVIKGYRAELDAAALGLTTLAFVQVSVAFDRHEAFERAVAAHPSVMACHATVGATDYLLQVIMPDMAALDDFLRQSLWRLPGVERFSTTLAMRAIKDAGWLTPEPRSEPAQ
jgi:Lrp/AsnC family leucine-responsive transcriptional regulator